MAIPKKIGLEQQAVKISDLVRWDREDGRTVPPFTFGKMNRSQLEFNGFTWLEHLHPGGGLFLHAALPGFGILFNHLKGVIVNGQNLLGFDKLYCPETIFRPHGEIISNGQYGQVDPLFADQFHVIKKARITGMIDLFSLYIEEETAGIAAVRTIWEG